jgi:biotin-(acetyl-CoA carboxylase) ligase
MTKLQSRLFDLEELGLQLISNIDYRYKQFELRQFTLLKQEFHQEMWQIGQSVEAIIADTKQTVKIIGTNEAGLLLLEIDGELKSFGLKEVKFIF